MRSSARSNAWIDRRAPAHARDSATTEPRSHSLRRIDSALLVGFIALLVGGLVMVYSASAAMSADIRGHSFHFLRKQLIAAVLGLIGGWAVMQIPPRQFFGHAKKNGSRRGRVDAVRLSAGDRDRPGRFPPLD